MLNEYNKYMNEPSAGIKEDIFEWWFKRKQLYPKLYSLVAKYLIIEKCGIFCLTMRLSSY